jgi:hypothetical protein
VAVSKGGIKVDMDLVKVLAEARPATLMTADATGSLPLHAALQQPGVDLDLVRYLVEQRPLALQHKNSSGMLPMHVAAAAAAAWAKTKADDNNNDDDDNNNDNSDESSPTPPPPDVVFYLASKWPQAVFGERDAVARVGETAAQEPQQPHGRRPLKRAKQA